jgi:hypothetical protein
MLLNVSLRFSNGDRGRQWRQAEWWIDVDGVIDYQAGGGQLSLHANGSSHGQATQSVVMLRLRYMLLDHNPPFNLNPPYAFPIFEFIGLHLGLLFSSHM